MNYLQTIISESPVARQGRKEARDRELSNLKTYNDVVGYLTENWISDNVHEKNFYELEDFMDIIHKVEGPLTFQEVEEEIFNFNYGLIDDALNSLSFNLGNEEWTKVSVKLLSEDTGEEYDAFLNQYEEEEEEWFTDLFVDVIQHFQEILYMSMRRGYLTKILDFAMKHNIEITTDIVEEKRDLMYFSGLVPREIKGRFISMANIECIVVCPVAESLFQDRPFISEQSIYMPKAFLQASIGEAD